jgi:hypothetical protein
MLKIPKKMLKVQFNYYWFVDDLALLEFKVKNLFDYWKVFLTLLFFRIKIQFRKIHEQIQKTVKKQILMRKSLFLNE